MYDLFFLITIVSAIMHITINAKFERFDTHQDCFCLLAALFVMLVAYSLVESHFEFFLS